MQDEILGFLAEKMPENTIKDQQKTYKKVRFTIEASAVDVEAFIHSFLSKRCTTLLPVSYNYETRTIGFRGLSNQGVHNVSLKHDKNTVDVVVESF